jgi:hypothetical protein
MASRLLTQLQPLYHVEGLAFEMPQEAICRKVDVTLQSVIIEAGTLLGAYIPSSHQGVAVR